MRKLIVFFSFWFSVTIVVAQNTERKLYSIAFYNLENLFDTIHDAGKNDYDFLPDGSYRWTAKKYEAKLHNLSDVLSSLSRNLVPEGPAVIGVAEVENHRVLTDLVSQPAMANYKFVHYEGPDRRGIDCALLYDPQQFAVTNSKLVLSAPFEGDTVHLTRGFLIVDGRMAGERGGQNHADRPGGGGPAGRFHQIAKKIKICFSDFFTNCLTFHWIDRYNTICTNLARRHPSPWTSAAMKRCANWLPAAAAKRRKLL